MHREHGRDNGNTRGLKDIKEGEKRGGASRLERKMVVFKKCWLKDMGLNGPTYT